MIYKCDAADSANDLILMFGKEYITIWVSVNNEPVEPGVVNPMITIDAESRWLEN